MAEAKSMNVAREPSMAKRKIRLTEELDRLKRANEKLESLVKTDALTELLNRRGLENVLVREMEYARRNKSDLLALIIDLDDFKNVNDSRGHFIGDLVLMHVAGILKNSFRSIDWIGRVGGDEFLVLLPSTSLKSGAQVAERVRQHLCQKTFASSDGDIRQTASFGLVSLPASISSIEEVLELTKISLKNSKMRGKNCISLDAGLASPSPFENQLPELMNADLYRVDGQPIIRFRDQQIVGFEMLTRGPCESLCRPADLFRASENHNILTTVDLNCFKAAIRKSMHLPEGAVCHVNLFPSTLVEVESRTILSLLTDLGPPARFCIELSEKFIKSNPEYLEEPLTFLRTQGVKLALDDVGFGHTCLESLFMLHPDYVKLDGNITRGIAGDKTKQRTIRSLVRLAQMIDAKTIAEEIENEADCSKAHELGVAWGQGWFLGAPRKIEEVNA
jgi:diguanylate cyclase (GGDEF)-like protein